ncbi:hypothetical protein HPB47_020913, partial [Ixodes persulcatus]
MLPVYQRLSQVSLLQRCLGAKTQNASESFHTVLWSLMPKEQHASLIAVETALHEAVLRFNAGCYKATAEILVAVGLQPAHLALQRAAEKDALRLHKASKRHQEKLERRNKKKVRKNTSDYSFCRLANRDDDIFLGVSITPECSSLKTPQESPERYRLEQESIKISIRKFYEDDTLANRDDDIFLGVSITPECSSLKTPQESPERYRLEQVKTEVVAPSCTLPDNFTGSWVNTANFDALVVINKTHMVERWKPDTGRFKEQIYVCVETRENRYLMARHGIHGCQRDYVCFDFVPRHQSVIRYRKGKSTFVPHRKEMITDVFSSVCSWTMFQDSKKWRYDILIATDPINIKCPVAGKFRFEQRGDIPFETRIRGGVTQIPRPNVYCRENISDFSVCDADQKIIHIDADYCISVDYYGRPVDIYSEPDYELKCIAFWKENLRSYLITYNKEDAYSKYRCWVYQRADLNRVLMSQSVGAFCNVRQDVTSSNYSEGAEVALDMIEYERE